MDDDANPVKLSVKELAKAIIDKANPASDYSKLPYWKDTKFTYKGIFKQARTKFDQYNRLYPTDEEFSKHFARDYWRREPKLWEIIFGKQADQPTQVKQTEAIAPSIQPQPTQTPSVPPPPVQPIKKPPPPPKEVETPSEEKPANASSQEKTNVSQPRPRFRFQLPKMPSGVRSLALKAGSSLGIAVKRTIGNRLSITAIAGGVGGALGGGLIGGPGGALAGALLGGVGGAVAPSVLGSPEGKSFLNNVGRGNVNSRGNFSPNRSKKSWFKGGRLLVSGFALSFLLLFIFGGFFASIGGPITPTGEAAPLPGSTAASINTQPSNDIASCKFIHQGNSYKIGSSKLANIISEVANKSGVPAAMLAGIAFQETSSFAFQTNDNHPAFSATSFPGNGCDPIFPTSVTGALGFMQVQPPSNISTYGSSYNPSAADLNGIKIGLSFLGRDPSSLTKNDFCDVRTSVYLAAGIIIDKNGGKPPVGSEDVRLASCKYMGQCQIGKYSYADEVKQGFDECKALSVANATVPAAEASSCPIPNGKALCGSKFTPLNGCGHCGIGYPPDQVVANCGFPGTQYSLDITAAVSQPAYLPQVNGEMIQWAYMGSESTIQKYAGTAANTSKKYYLQFHHTQPGSASVNGGPSGTVGAVIGAGNNHLHIQIGEGGTNQGNTSWLDAAQYFCRNK